MIAIDTSVAVGFLRGDRRAVSAVESALEGSGSVGISTVSMFEILHPIYHRKLVRHEKEVRGFFRELRVLPLDAEAADEAARVMGGLLRVGRKVNPLDVLIAGAALASSADKIISSDGDFQDIAKVSDLKADILR